MLLSSSTTDVGSYDRWCVIEGDEAELDASLKVSDISSKLDSAFDQAAGEWWELGRALQTNPTSRFAHAPMCAPNVSDLGVMLAWTRLVREWIQGGERVLVVCLDPWLFRQLEEQGCLRVGRRPALWPRQMRFAARGLAARTRASLRFALSCWRARPLRRRWPAGGRSLLSYVHPNTKPNGDDAYFGRLFRDDPTLVRLLHVDGRWGQAKVICEDGRTASLHAWGSLWRALTLLFCRWRPRDIEMRGRYGWLLRRAAALEGSTAQAAAVAWQIHCQRRWLRRQRPRMVVWPWENHGWERDLVDAAQQAGVSTAGYQHALVGRQEFNYALAANRKGVAEIPDRILCSGDAAARSLEKLGLPGERMTLAGACRYPGPTPLRFGADGPVLFALCTERRTAQQMVDAAARLARRSRAVLVKEHPMAPRMLRWPAGLTPVRSTLGALEPLCAVVYAASTIGIEAMAAGIPTLRFMPDRGVALDPLPAGVPQATVTAATLEDALHMAKAIAVEWHDFFSPPDPAAWRQVLGSATS